MNSISNFAYIGVGLLLLWEADQQPENGPNPFSRKSLISPLYGVSAVFSRIGKSRNARYPNSDRRILRLGVYDVMDDGILWVILSEEYQMGRTNHGKKYYNIYTYISNF